MSMGDDIEGQKVATSNESKGEPQQFRTVASAPDEQDLLPVVDDVPFPVWLIAFVGAAERFAWYGATSPLPENYIQYSPSSKIPGVLGLREATATNIVNAMMAAGYLATIPAAVVADMWLGRYGTVLVSVLIQLCGSAILFGTSFPRAVQAGAAEGGLATAIVLIALGSGGVRSSIAPFISTSQWKHNGAVHRDKSQGQGAKERTKGHHRSRAYKPIHLQYVLLVVRTRASFRHLALLTPRATMVNVGGLSALITTILEKYIGYWALWRHALVQRPPSGSVLLQASRAMVEAPPTFIDELKSGLLACRVFVRPHLLFPIHWLCLNQTFNNLISQAGQMVDSGVPNDIIRSLNPIASINLTPVFTSRSCRNYQIIPNQISMFLQTPIYVLGAIAGIFCFTMGTEYAYNQAPKTMKSVVQSVWMATAGVGACLAMAFTPITTDPHLVIMYSSLTGVKAVMTVLFGVFLGKHDRKKAVPL
ncbi:hypothetical protein BDV33DRAFT_192954 [Aspergillus novoparasiticus]|uniref:Oligopeptide transporter n=1 Tax=Aspergillus novoparasiticus TaxID=986946 RepID=A0A5N6EP28_9EURO|nr:hypothetical protein BDV33DRAFT_192954 [Aspergillus novoparasiticus]